MMARVDPLIWLIILECSSYKVVGKRRGGER